MYFLRKFGSYVFVAALASFQSCLARVESGDFLVFTFATSVSQQLSVISPTGSLRTSIALSNRNEGFINFMQTAVSPDGEYAFTTAVGIEEMIYVTSLKGDTPKVIQKLTFPSRKSCSFALYTSIAVGPRSRNGNYALYIARQCNKGCPQAAQEFGEGVLELRYITSTGKLSKYVKTAYFPDNLICGRESPIILRLQLLKGKLYAIMVIAEEATKLFRLISPSTASLVSSKKLITCQPPSFTIVSPTQFIGICVPPQADSYDYISVRDNKTTNGQPAPREKIKVDLSGTNTADRYFWDGSIANGPGPHLGSRAGYAILRDRKDDKNQTLYRFDLSAFGQPPKVMGKLDPSVLASFGFNREEISVSQLHRIP